MKHAQTDEAEEELAAAIKLNPYQGLKLVVSIYKIREKHAAIKLNPYQGLKQQGL